MNIPKTNIIKRAFNALWQNPIIVKELRSRMRRKRSYLILTLFLIFSAGIVSLVYFGVAETNDFYPDPDVRRTLGQAIFLTVVLLQLGAVNFVTPAFTAGSIASERENQTYDLLRTTPVSAKDIVRGKLLSGLLFTLLLLIATIPMQSMAFLFGGIEPSELIIATLMIVVTATTFSAIGIYASTLLKRSVPATILAYAIANGGLIILPLLYFIIAFFVSTADIPVNFLSSYDPTENLVGFFILATILWILVSSNPVIAAAISDILLTEEGVLFFWGQDINPTLKIYIPSPWMGFVIINLFIAWLFYRGAIRRISRREKQ